VTYLDGSSGAARVGGVTDHSRGPAAARTAVTARLHSPLAFPKDIKKREKKRNICWLDGMEPYVLTRRTTVSVGPRDNQHSLNFHSFLSSVSGLVLLCFARDLALTFLSSVSGPVLLCFARDLALT
jgi:hypothetical protein